MKLKENLIGSTVYIKNLDRNIEVNESNAELLKSAGANVFESAFPVVRKSKRNDKNK